jgi:hypothetical protein
MVGTICVGKFLVHGRDPPEVQGFFDMYFLRNLSPIYVKQWTLELR